MDDTSEAAPQEHVAETAAAVMDSSHAEVAEQQSGGAGSAMTATKEEEQVGDVVNEEPEQLGGDGEVAVNSPAEGAAPLGGENLSKEREAEEGDRLGEPVAADMPGGGGGGEAEFLGEAEHGRQALGAE